MTETRAVTVQLDSERGSPFRGSRDFKVVTIDFDPLGAGGWGSAPGEATAVRAARVLGNIPSDWATSEVAPTPGARRIAPTSQASAWRIAFSYPRAN